MISKLISIVVVAHSREKFLPEAIDSILGQSENKDKIEIIIVSNFKPTFLKDLQTKIPIKHIFTEKETLLEKILIGMQKSNGEFIAFLEDDDTFEKIKVKTLLEIISDEKEVAYIHNSQNIIDSKSNLIDSSFRKNVEDKIIFKPEQLSTRKLRHLLSNSPDFNLSSICVRKNIFLNELMRMPRTVDAIDTMFFHIALSSGMKIVLVPDHLTNYRFHPSQSNKVGGYEEFYLSKYEYTKNYLRSLISLSKCVGGNLSKSIIKGIIKDVSLNFYLLNKAPNRKEMLSCSISLLKWARYFPRRYVLLKVSLAILYLFSPQLAKWAYYRNRANVADTLTSRAR